MRYVVVTHDDLPLHMLDPGRLDHGCLVITDNEKLARRARRRGYKGAVGDLSSPALYRRVKLGGGDRVLVCLSTTADVGRAVAAIESVSADAAVTVFSDGAPLPPDCKLEGRCRELHLGVLTNTLRGEMEMAAAVKSVAKIRNIFEGAERVLLLVQDDPDPDGIASAIAMRVLLGRNRLTAPIGSFGEVTRPENLAMIRLLDVEINTITADDLDGFDRVALLDVQPFHSPDIPTRVDAVVDHHPRRTNYTARFKDVRPRYGATSTIMTEYLLASHSPISQRLATALLYGIKTDTQLLGRDTTSMDVQAFAALYPLANQSTLRRIDRPQIPRDDLASFSTALLSSEVEDDVIYAHMGPLSREDVIPYFADLCLEVENVEWSVASGVFEGQLIISIRSYGHGRAAGEVTKAAFEQYGSAGGHRAMSKAVIPLENIPPQFLDHAQWVRYLFKQELSVCVEG